MVLALRCGIRAAAKRTPRKLQSHGDVAGGECGMVNENGLEWKQLPNTTTWNYQGIPRTKTLFLWKELGRGATGRAFLACSKNGTACVLKFFLYDDSSVNALVDPVAQKQKSGQLLQDTKEKADAECHMWKKVYAHYSKHVRVLKLNNLWALQMPFFNPVQKDAIASTLPKVKLILELFKKLGYSYRRDDLRWRHVGFNSKGDCILFDLESLVAIDNPEKIEIDESMTILSEKMK